MDAIEALKTRRSIRAFKPDPIDKSVLEDIIDCARMAATARNDQPWEFIVVTDEEMRGRLADKTNYGKFIQSAPACIVVICKDTKYFLEDGSAATQNILLAAHAHGLGACWVAGDKKPYAASIGCILGASTEYSLVSLVAIGHPASASPPAPKRELNKVIHWEKF